MAPLALPRRSAFRTAPRRNPDISPAETERMWPFASRFRLSHLGNNFLGPNTVV